MANLYYRHQVPVSLPESVTAKSAPLTVAEMNANFKALDDAINSAYADVEAIEEQFIDTVNVFTKNQSVSSLTPYKSSNVITINASLSNNFRIDMDDDYLLQNPTNYGSEQTLNFFIKQGSTPHTLTFDTKYIFPNNVNPPLVYEPYAIHLMSAHYDSFSGKFICSITRYFLPSRYVLGSVSATFAPVASLDPIVNVSALLPGNVSLAYSGDITAVQPDPYWSDVILLLNAQNSITTDSSSFNNTLTINESAVINSDQPLFSFPAYYIPNDTSSRIQIDNNFFNGKYGPNEWCVETWYYPTTSNDLDGRFCSFGRVSLERKSNGQLIGRTFIGGSSYSISTATGLVLTGSWYHIALVRDNTSNLIKLFVNGNLVGSSTSISPSLEMDTTGFGWVIGYNSSGSFGYFSNLRVTKNHARYYSNFDVPTAPFPTA